MRRTVMLLLIVLLLGSIGVWILYARDIAAAHQRLAGKAQTVETSYGAVGYAEAGSGTSLLVIHGSGGGFDQSLEMAGPLAKQGFRLIAPSRFGYLGTPMPANADPAMQADALAEFLDQLTIGRAVIFGGSAGALPAMQLAIRHPERCQALVLFVPAAYAPDRKPNESAMTAPWQEALIRAVLRSDFLFWAGLRLAPATMTRFLLATESAVVQAASEAEQARVAAILEHILPISPRAEGLVFDMKFAGTPPRYELEKIACPVLAVSARDDLYGTAAAAEYTAANVPHGQAVIYPTGGHILAGHDTDVWQAITAFLRSSE